MGMSYTFAKNAILSLTRNSLSTTYALGGKSVNDSDALALNYSWKTLNFDASLSNNNSNVQSSYALLGLTPTAGSTNQFLDNSSSTFSKRLAIGWQPKSWLHLTGSISDNNIKNNAIASNATTTARDSSINAQFSLIRNLRINYTYSLSDSGNNGTATTLTNGTTTVTTGTTTGTTTTGTTATGTTSTITGTNVRSLFLPFWLTRIPGRDIVAGGTTTTTTGNTSALSSSSIGTLFGGGVNSNLGGVGNYSGYLGAGSTNSYGLTTFGGKNYQNSLRMDYQPRPNLLIGFQFDNGASIGDYQYNSSRNNLGFNLGWQLSNRMQFNASFQLQKTAYTGSVGGSQSRSMLVAFQGHPFGGKIGLQLNWSSLVTKSAFDFSTLGTTVTGLTTGTTSTTATTGTTGTGTTGLSDTSSTLNSLGLRVDYPISSRQTLFVETLNSTTSGYLGNSENDLRFGMDYGLTRTLKFSLGWQILQHQYKDPASANLNYKASSLLAEFGFHF